MNKKEITQLSYDLVGFAIKIHKELGQGLLESVYEECLKYEISNAGYSFESQKNVPLYYENLKLDAHLRYDLLVEKNIVIEIKTVENLLPVHEAQLLTYMKLLKVPQGLLINFYTDNITKSMKPFVNEYFRNLKD